MNLMQIKQFLTIVKYMNLSTAAKELYVSQPALSLSLSRMEEFLGVKLFFRGGNKLVLSPAGEALLEDFKTISHDFDNLVNKANLLKSTTSSSINIGFSCSATLFASMFMNDFLANYKDIPIKKIFVEWEQTVNMLKTGQIDFAITYLPMEDEAISNLSIMTEPILLVVSNNHPLAAKKSVSFKELENIPFIGLSRHHYFRITCDTLCRRNNFYPNYVKECEYTEQRRLISKYAGTNQYVSFCAKDSFANYYGNGFTMVPIESDTMFRTTSISWLTERKLQYQYDDLIKHIVDGFPAQYILHLKLIQSFN